MFLWMYMEHEQMESGDKHQKVALGNHNRVVADKGAMDHERKCCFPVLWIPALVWGEGLAVTNCLFKTYGEQWGYCERPTERCREHSSSGWTWWGLQSAAVSAGRASHNRAHCAMWRTCQGHFLSCSPWNDVAAACQHKPADPRLTNTQTFPIRMD